MSAPTTGKRDVRTSKKAKAEKGASVRFVPIDTVPRLHAQGTLPVLPRPTGADTSTAVDLASASGLRCTDSSEPDPDGQMWTALAECDAHFPLSAWTTLMHLLVKHPERNSSYILRADILAQVDHTSQLSNGQRTAPSRLAQVVTADLDSHSSDSASDSHDSHRDDAQDKFQRPLVEYKLNQTTYRRLLPRNPTLDSPLDQLCYFYDRPAEHDPTQITQDSQRDGLVIYVPLLPAGATAEDVPWYHPKGRALAFRYLSSYPGNALPDGTPSTGKLRIDALLFPSDKGPTKNGLADEPNSRLLRTCKALLDLQHKHSLGIARSYVKRVQHDVLVPQAAFQDRYMALKQVHGSRLVSTWKEATDPQKHVWEDVAITAYLIELWNRTYDRGHPPGGFVDLGCGNGLLVHLLRSEGYEGFGVDVRARQSWTQYETRPHLPVDKRDLRVFALDPPSMVASAIASQDGGDDTEDELAKILPRDCFLIGNHADELTPWVPLLATCAPGTHVGFLNIPCCPWRLEGDRFGRTTMNIAYDDVRTALLRAGHPAPATESVQEVQSALVLGPPNDEPDKPKDVRGPAQARTRNAAYLAYISWLQLQCGWMVEKEPLRIPSTKNWALVGRTRAWHGIDKEQFVYQTRPSTADPHSQRTLVAGNARPFQPQVAHPAFKEVLKQVGTMALVAQAWTPRVPEGNTARLAPSAHEH